MNLAVFLAIGESIEDFRKKGQDSLIINNNYYQYSKKFSKVYVFSYKDESLKYFSNVIVIPNKFRVHRYFYIFLIPLIHFSIIKNCDVIRAYQVTGGLTGLIGRVLFNKNYVVNYGYDYPRYALIEDKKILAFILKLIEIPVLYYSSSVIVTAKNLIPTVRKYNSAVNYIPNGVNTSLFLPRNIKKTIDILYIGRFEVQKNLDYIIKSCQLLKNYKFNVVFIGSGSLKSYLRTQAKVRKVNLKIISSVSNRLLPRYYNKAKIFILPSQIEGNPKSLLEAMSCGLPVIGNRVLGISSIINSKNGLLFNNSVESLVKKIEVLIRNKRLQYQLGKNARVTIINKYEVNKSFSKEISLLKKYT